MSLSIFRPKAFSTRSAMSPDRSALPHQPLDAVRHHALSARPEPIAEDEPTQFSGLANGMTPLAAGSHASPTHFRLETVGYHAAALAQGVAGAPQIVSADAVEQGVDAVTSKALNLLHEVHVLVVDEDAAQFPDDCGPLRRARFRTSRRRPASPTATSRSRRRQRLRGSTYVVRA